MFNHLYMDSTDHKIYSAIREYQLAWQNFQYAENDYIDKAIEHLNHVELILSNLN